MTPITWVLLISVICATIIALSAMGIYWSIQYTEIAMKHGYSQQAIYGKEGVYWVKNGEILDTNRLAEKSEGN